MEVSGGKPGHVDGCTGWCFLSSCIVVAQPIFSDAQVCPLHEVMDIYFANITVLVGKLTETLTHWSEEKNPR